MDEMEKLMHDLKTKIGKHVEGLRLAKNWSQAELAERAMTDRGIIAAIEGAADRSYGIDVLLAVLIALDSAEDIIFADSLSKTLHERLTKVIRAGDIDDINFVAQALERAVRTYEPPGKPRRSA